MARTIIIITLALFILLVFPIYVFNYVYVNTAEGYASINICLYRYIKLFNVNTAKNLPMKMQVNGKEVKLNPKAVKRSFFRILNSIRISKIVQLCDLGMQSESSAYVGLVQNTLTNAIYDYVKYKGKGTKLKNYTIYNYEHSHVNYYMKTVSVINLIIIAKIILIVVTEKLNELKKQKQKRKRI